jgi:hypothetical protein
MIKKLIYGVMESALYELIFNKLPFKYKWYTWFKKLFFKIYNKIYIKQLITKNVINDRVKTY